MYKAKNRYLGAASALLILAAALSGCASAPVLSRGSDKRFAATLPPAPVPAENNQGSIYQPALAQGLFEDYKARRVGDVLTVVLAEKTDASKSANSSTSRNAAVQLQDPTLFGRPVTRGGAPVLNTNVASQQSFKGGGSAEQSNQLQGSIAVTVAKVLANGNLVVQGEKWIRINHGQEYIQLRGIVRPVDIDASNSVLSTQIADAELAYGGTGPVSHSSMPGWLSRFFNSPLWPF